MWKIHHHPLVAGEVLRHGDGLGVVNRGRPTKRGQHLLTLPLCALLPRLLPTWLCHFLFRFALRAGQTFILASTCGSGRSLSLAQLNVSRFVARHSVRTTRRSPSLFDRVWPQYRPDGRPGPGAAAALPEAVYGQKRCRSDGWSLMWGRAPSRPSLLLSYCFYYMVCP
ncbi:unnamed protein product [Tetraodon nigroviridis]|uniref:(spotted green pufferfish) hypothetical protein n=1 Tax=Tetraodon nigroviridis TaxID=99883 RepID=Q4TI94_TETNG|nr:unnamed protein product [Tetraodon nigroviridis]